MQTNDIYLPTQSELSEEAQVSIIKLRGFFRSMQFALDAKKPETEENALTSIIANADMQELKNALLVVFKEADFT
jgi:hypothetical protein